MIKKTHEMAKEIRENMRGGNGTTEITHIFTQEEIKGKARLCAKVTIPAGGSIGMHEHANEEEIYYIIKGKGLINDNGETREIYPGDSVLTGNGASHAIENIGEETLEMMAIILTY